MKRATGTTPGEEAHPAGLRRYNTAQEGSTQTGSPIPRICSKGLRAFPATRPPRGAIPTISTNQAQLDPFRQCVDTAVRGNSRSLGDSEANRRTPMKREAGTTPGESHAVGLRRCITAMEVSTQTGIPLPRIYQLAREGHLPVVRLGRAMRFDPEAVAQWLSAGGTGPWSP